MLWMELMANVYLWAGASRFIEHDNPLNINGKTVAELFKNLLIRYPNLENIFNEGVSCAVDDKLIFNSSVEVVSENSEVYIFQKISGG